MRKFLTVLITALALFVLTIPALANGRPEKVTICHAAGLADEPANWVTLELAPQAYAGHFDENGTPQAGHENDYLGACVEETTTTTTLPDETTTTTEPQPVVKIEVCRDKAIVFIDPGELLDTDERLFTDSQRRHCLPKVPTTPNPTPPGGSHVTFPPISVGYACPGTDGVVVELPWGTYEDLLPTPEQAAQTCPTIEATPVVNVEAPTTTEVLTVLPFTGPSDSLPFLALAGLAALGLGGLMVRSARSDG